MGVGAAGVRRESQWRDEMSAVTVINCFEVPAGWEGEFLELWRKVNAYMQRKPGYLGNKLHRAITPDVQFQFVHVAQWASMAHFQGAHDTGFRELVDQPAWSAFVPHRVLLEVVHEGQADSGSSEGGWHGDGVSNASSDDQRRGAS